MERRKYNDKFQENKLNFDANKLNYLRTSFMLNQLHTKLSPSYLYKTSSASSKYKNKKKSIHYNKVCKQNILQILHDKDDCIVVGKKQIQKRRKSIKQNNVQKNINPPQNKNCQILQAFKSCKVQNFYFQNAFDNITKPEPVKFSNQKNISFGLAEKYKKFSISQKKQIQRPCSGQKQNNKQISRPWAIQKKLRIRKLTQSKQIESHESPQMKIKPPYKLFQFSLQSNDFNPWDVESFQNSQI